MKETKLQETAHVHTGMYRLIHTPCKAKISIYFVKETTVE